VTLSIGNGTVRLSLSGPEGVWFGVGFFAQSMADKPYAVVVDGEGAISERRMANHAAGSLLPPVATVVSSSVAAGRRTVVLTRPTLGSSGHANFSTRDVHIPLITAVGSAPSFSYHRNATAASLQLWPAAGAPLCLCEEPAAPFGAAEGTLRYLPTGEESGFVNECEPEPRESILEQRNPTCDMRTYSGGLQVCKHGWYLLDAEQEVPWDRMPLVYYQKYRFYFQEFQPQTHIVSATRDFWGWGIGAAGGHAEYDVERCPPGTPTARCRHRVWGIIAPGGEDLHFAAIHFHCHAAACLAMEIYNNNTGELLCHQEPIYGGTGKVDLPKYDEPGYLLIPPCLWAPPSHPQPGLQPMPRASGQRFLIVAITNSTYGHHGEMAFPEVTLAPLHPGPWR